MDLLKILQANSFLVSLILMGAGGGIMTFLRFRSMHEKIHTLSKRLSKVEDERIAHLELLVSTQGNTLSTINERTQNMSVSLTRIEDHLLSRS